MIKNDILGYLLVLNTPEVLDRLTTEEHRIGRANIMGCFSRLMESLEKDLTNEDYNVMFMRIKHREHLNARKMLPVGHPELVAATQETSWMLLESLRGGISPSVKQQFLTQLDESLTKILENHSWK